MASPPQSPMSPNANSRYLFGPLPPPPLPPRPASVRHSDKSSRSINFENAVAKKGHGKGSSNASVTPSPHRSQQVRSAPQKSLVFGFEFEQENRASKINAEIPKIDSDGDTDEDDKKEKKVADMSDNSNGNNTRCRQRSISDIDDTPKTLTISTTTNEEHEGSAAKALLKHGRARSQPELSGSLLNALHKQQHTHRSASGGRSPRAASTTITKSIHTLLRSQVKTCNAGTQTLPMFNTSASGRNGNDSIIGRRRSHEIRRSRGSRGKSLGGALALFSDTKIRVAAPLLGAKKLIQDALTVKEQQLEELKSTPHENAKQVRFIDQKRGEVQADISSFSNELRWVESTIHAQEGQTRALRRSASDWASMMVQSAHHHEQHKLIRLVQQGVMVKKHSAKRWGCGFRFMAVDKCALELRYVKNLENSPMIFFDQPNGFSRKGPNSSSSNSTTSSSSTPSSASSSHVGSTPPRRPGSAGKGGTPPVSRTVFKSPAMKVVRLAMVSKLLYGRDAVELGVQVKALSSQGGSGSNQRKRASSLSADECVDSYADLVPRFVALQTEKEIGNVKTLFIEFPTEAQAEDFFLGLQATILRAQNRFGTTKFVEGKKGKNGKGKGAFMTSAHVDFQNAKFHASRNNNKNNQGGGGGTDGLALLTLELQKTLSQVGSKHEYIRALLSLDPHGLGVGAGLSSLAQHPLVLPLASSSERRETSEHMAQALKDLSRESEINFNAHRYELGHIDAVNFFIDDLSEYLNTTFGGTGHSSSSGGNGSIAGRCTPLSDSLSKLCDRIILASTRTFFEGDIFDLCHRLLSVHGKVILCPVSQLSMGQMVGGSEDGHGNNNEEEFFSVSPVSVLVSNDGLITIESETIYRIVNLPQDDGDGLCSPEEWGGVRVQCIEHMNCMDDENGEDNGADGAHIRHVRLNWLF